MKNTTKMQLLGEHFRAVFNSFKKPWLVSKDYRMALCLETPLSFIPFPVWVALCLLLACLSCLSLRQHKWLHCTESGSCLHSHCLARHDCLSSVKVFFVQNISHQRLLLFRENRHVHLCPPTLPIVSLRALFLNGTFIGPPSNKWVFD